MPEYIEANQLYGALTEGFYVAGFTFERLITAGPWCARSTTPGASGGARRQDEGGGVMNDIAPRSSSTRDVAIYDPERGLKEIAVAEAGEKHWARAKNPDKLFEAIELKLEAQRDYVAWRDGVVLPPSNRGQGRGRNQISVLKSDLPEADPGHLVAHRWRKKLATDAAFAVALEDAKLRCQRICEQQKMGTVRGTEGTGEFELFTPEACITAARAVLGEIDLDPASDAIAQKTVRAGAFFTIADDGLVKDWFGRVWLNPPYHRKLLPSFIRKLIAERAAGRVAAAIMLTNNCTDTEWFEDAVGPAQAVCFTHGRIRFKRPHGEEVAPTQGQTFFYFGADAARFARVFQMFGFGFAPLWERQR
jgi:DNA N-6-adenine-methyltransferase (Dam)